MSGAQHKTTEAESTEITYKDIKKRLLVYLGHWFGTIVNNRLKPAPNAAAEYYYICFFESTVNKVPGLHIK